MVCTGRWKAASTVAIIVLAGSCAFVAWWSDASSNPQGYASSAFESFTKLQIPPRVLLTDTRSKCNQELQQLRKWWSQQQEAARLSTPRRRLLQKVEDSDADVDSLDRTLAALKEDIAAARAEQSRLAAQKYKVEVELSTTNYNWSTYFMPPEAMAKAKKLVDGCGGKGIILPVPGPVWKGYACQASDEDIGAYLNYDHAKRCPDDWFATQDLIFTKHCYSLPQRRCLSPTPQAPSKPMSFPSSIFSQPALKDDNVRWNRHNCKSFECLNTRLLGDCRNCFNMSLEKKRWWRGYRGSLSAKDVMKLTKGTIRLGLDAGGGTGSFAARMATFGATVMTTAMNIETVMGRRQGLPYMEAIALRGLIPLHLPHKARLPFFDGTLDLIHCVNSVKYLPMLEFEELLYDWDRVLRVGGFLWFEMFYAPVDEMHVYISIIEQLGYKKLYWNIMPKPDEGERVGNHIYLNCLIEKPVRRDRNFRGLFWR